MELAEVVGMEWSPERNIELRKALRMTHREVGMINQGGVIILVVFTKTRALMLFDRIAQVFPYAEASKRPRVDGKWVVTFDVHETAGV